MDECASRIMKIEGKHVVLEENKQLKNPTLKGHWKFSPKLSACLKEVVWKSQHKLQCLPDSFKRIVFYLLFPSNIPNSVFGKQTATFWIERKAEAIKTGAKLKKNCFPNRDLRKEVSTEMLSREIWWNVATVKYICTEKISSRDCVTLLLSSSSQSFYTSWEARSCGQQNTQILCCRDTPQNCFVSLKRRELTAHCGIKISSWWLPVSSNFLSTVK